MSTDLNIHLSEQAFVGLQQAATAAGRTPVEQAAAALEEQFGAMAANGDRGKSIDCRRIEDFFGSIDLDYPVGVDNEQIDADLAKEYGRTHDGD